MKNRPFSTILAVGLLGLTLTACAMPSAQTNPTTAPNVSATEVLAQPTAAPLLIPTAASQIETQPTSGTIGLSDIVGITAEGAIVPAQDASLLFGVQGTVGQVLVKEGDKVEAGQVLAVLVTDALDLQVSQAQASLAGAQAQLASLTENPRETSLAAAQAQLQSAETQLAQLKAGPKPQDLANARAGLAAAQANLETQRNNLSAQKTRAESAVEQAANQLRNAQDEYSRIYWQNRELEKLPGPLPESAKNAEEAAARAVANAEENLRQAQVALDNARLAEKSGTEAATQQVAQAQAGLDKLLAGATPEQLAAAEAAVAQARAQVDQITNPSTASQRAAREASVAQATAALESAKYNRSQAELKAPFAGLIADVNIDVGDPSSSAGAAAIRLIDASQLSAEVNVSDVDIAKVSVGQSVRLTIQSLPDKTFIGKVSYIAPAATVTGNVRSYTVRISIDDQSGLLAGMRARASIETK